MNILNKENLLTLKDVAKELSVQKQTVKNWLSKGLFPNAIIDSEQQWYILKDEINALPKVKKIDEKIIRNSFIVNTGGQLPLVDRI